MSWSYICHFYRKYPRDSMDERERKRERKKTVKMGGMGEGKGFLSVCNYTFCFSLCHLKSQSVFVHLHLGFWKWCNYNPICWIITLNYHPIFDSPKEKGIRHFSLQKVYPVSILTGGKEDGKLSMYIHLVNWNRLILYVGRYHFC